jgi:hypothetical protein
MQRVLVQFGSTPSEHSGKESLSTEGSDQVIPPRHAIMPADS